MSQTIHHKGRDDSATQNNPPANHGPATNVKRLHPRTKRESAYFPAEMPPNTASDFDKSDNAAAAPVPVSDKIAGALIDENDPAHLLTTLRDTLFGPTRKLQEARMEELVAILEETDGTFRRSVQKINEQIATIESVNDRHANDLAAHQFDVVSKAKTLSVDIAETNRKIDDLSENLVIELQRNDKGHKLLIEEVTALVTARLDHMAADHAKQLADMATNNQLTVQALMSDFTIRLQDLAAASKAGDEKIMAQVDSRLLRHESADDEHKRRNIQALTEGLSYMSERITALHNA